MESFMHQTWWLYDLTVLAVLILCIWGGWRRGLISSVAGLLGYAAAALLAGVLAQPAAEYVYDRWLAEPCAAILEQKMEQYHLADDLQQTLGNYGIQLDDAALQQIADNPDNASEELYSVVCPRKQDCLRNYCSKDCPRVLTVHLLSCLRRCRHGCTRRSCRSRVHRNCKTGLYRRRQWCSPAIPAMPQSS